MPESEQVLHTNQTRLNIIMLHAQKGMLHMLQALFAAEMVIGSMVAQMELS